MTDATKELDGAPHYRAGEVKEYLESHPEIERFVIIDDGYGYEFGELFPEQFVHTGYRFEAHDRAARAADSVRAAGAAEPSLAAPATGVAATVTMAPGARWAPRRQRLRAG